ncbi:MAG: hypothetical protein ABI168_11965 [Ginsengibacter sp.]
MHTLTPALTTVDGIIAHPKKETTTKETWLERDIVLNVGFKESINRCVVSIFLPWPFVMADHLLLLYVAPVMFYLFVSGLTHFCVIRYAWRHFVKHIPDPLICSFAIDLDIPVKAI